MAYTPSVSSVQLSIGYPNYIKAFAKVLLFLESEELCIPVEVYTINSCVLLFDSKHQGGIIRGGLAFLLNKRRLGLLIVGGSMLNRRYGDPKFQNYCN